MQHQVELPIVDGTIEENSNDFPQSEIQSPSVSLLEESPQSLSFVTLLQHFAAYTGQKLSHMTYLLKLLKTHKPSPYYDELPNSGRELLKISCTDSCSPEEGCGSFSKRMPEAKKVNEGKYFHFGLENALLGNSPGIVHRHSDLLQYVEVYKNHPYLLPTPIRNKVR